MGKLLSKLKMLKYVWAAKWLVLAYLLVISANSTKGPLEFAFYFAGLLLFAFAGAIASFVGLIIGLVKRKPILFHIIVLVSFILLILAIRYDDKVGSEETEKSMKIGDELVKIVENYKDENGIYPKDYNELPEAAKKLAPTLRNSSFFYYTNEKENNFYVGFHAHSWLICERANDKDWVCDD